MRLWWNYSKKVFSPGRQSPGHLETGTCGARHPDRSCRWRPKYLTCVMTQNVTTFLTQNVATILTLKAIARKKKITKIMGWSSILVPACTSEG